MIARLGAAATIFAMTYGTAFAVFFEFPDVPTVPEPTSAALFAAGGLAVVGVRYLTKRKKDK
jgi:hypothetical protein